jgi:phosphatidylserine/phosphatidylglycerophosphate/cardiolipin synthase-like enzyme
MLNADNLTSIAADEAALLLSYLNLPPVGCFADLGERFDPHDEASFEVSAPLRSALGERRAAHGGRFSSLGELVGVDGFGPAELDAMVQRLGDRSRYGHRIETVWGGPDGEKRFFELIESAERYIHISTYIIGGQTGLRLARLLAEKVRSGVQVRLLFCASGFVISGSPSGTGFVSRFSELRSYLLNDMYVRKKIVRELRAAGVPFINSSPIGRHWKRRDLRQHGIRSADEYYGEMRRRGLPDAWLAEQEKIDAQCSVAFANVDHRKMVIVDGEKAFVGSQNLADSYFYTNELSSDPRVNVRNWQWHDNSTIIEGGIVARLNALFAQRWMLSGGDVFAWDDAFYEPRPRIAGHATVGIIPTIPGLLAMSLEDNLGGILKSLIGFDGRPIPRGQNPIRERMMRLPEFANSDLYVEHCYPSDSGLLEHWKEAARRLPEFHMVVPIYYDTKVLGDECDRFFPEMIAAGASLHGYSRAIMHSKIAVMDGWYVVTGSYNMTLRSARADLESEFFIQCPQYGQDVRDRIRHDMRDCRPVRPGLFDHYRSRWSVPIFDAVVRYFFL